MRAVSGRHLGHHRTIVASDQRRPQSEKDVIVERPNLRRVSDRGDGLRALSVQPVFELEQVVTRRDLDGITPNENYRAAEVLIDQVIGDYKDEAELFTEVREGWDCRTPGRTEPEVDAAIPPMFCGRKNLRPCHVAEVPFGPPIRDAPRKAVRRSVLPDVFFSSG